MRTILLLVFLVLVAGTLSLASATGLVQLPVLTDALYGSRVGDFGVEADRGTAEEFLARSQSEILSGRPFVITEEEATSLVHLYCSENPDCPLQDFQVRFEEERFSVSALISEPITGDVTVIGNVERAGEKSVDLTVEKVYLGNVPVPFFKETMEEFAEDEINKALSRAEGLEIQDIRIQEGAFVFIGTIPFETEL